MTLRKKHTAKFKTTVAIETIKERKTAAEIASDMEFIHVMVSQWKKAAIESVEIGFSDRRGKPKETDGFERDQLQFLEKSY